MSFHVIDHTDREWSAKVRYENGARTYSRDILAHHLPAWREKFIGSDVTISTAPPLTGRELPGGDVAVQYLHHHDPNNPLARPVDMAEHLSRNYERVIIVTSMQSFAIRLQQRGVEAVFVPMTVDVASVRSHAQPVHKRNSRVLYLGNVYGMRAELHKSIARTLSKSGVKVDTVSKGRLLGSGRTLTQQQIWSLASTYKYGVAVGRSALELLALGVRVIIAGAFFGGVMLDDEHFAQQESATFSGRVTTFDTDVMGCYEVLDQTITRTNDYPRAVEAIRAVSA